MNRASNVRVGGAVMVSLLTAGSPQAMDPPAAQPPPCAAVEGFRALDFWLAYYIPVTDTWKQVWVTGRATAPGGVKEKTLVERLRDGALRFQGEIAVAGGGTYLDRTTLTPLPGGEVRQVIELSRDGGSNRETGFDAVYRRRGADAGR